MTWFLYMGFHLNHGTPSGILQDHALLHALMHIPFLENFSFKNYRLDYIVIEVSSKKKNP